jgi:hypothetical protein
MRAKILQTFSWLILVQDVKKFCRNHVDCHRTKPQIKARAELQPIKHKGAWEFVLLDHLEKLPKTKSGHTHVLAIIDQFTKRVELIAIKQQKGWRFIHRSHSEQIEKEDHKQVWDGC